MENEVINNIQTVSKSVSDYGPTIVIIATFIVLFTALILIILNSNKKQLASILEQNKALVDNLLKEKTQNTGKNFVKNYIDAQLVFKNASRLVLDRMKADRVGIYVFHNGNKSSYGFPFYKMSCIGEYVHKSLNTNCKAKNHTDIPLFAFDGIVEALYNNGYFENLSNIDNKKDEVESFTNSVDSNTDTERVYMQGIIDKEGNLAGFSIIEFKRMPNLTIEDIKEEMQLLNRGISNIIIESKIQEKT